MLKDNLIEVEEHIKKACEKSGRNPEDVCLVAVSKTKPKDMTVWRELCSGDGGQGRYTS